LVGISGEQLWAGQFDEKFTDIFAVQDAISGRVAGALSLQLGGEDKRRLTKHYTDNPAAYELYLRGRYHLFKLTPPEVRKAAEFFQQAVDADPAYALAYTGIADAYRTLPITSDVAPKDAFPKATEAVTKALQLDDSLAEAHALRGWIRFWFEWDWASSESDFRRAIDLDPNNADAHRGYAHLLSNTGRHEQALAEVEKARGLDPLSLITNTLQGQFLHSAGHDEEAGRSFEKALELDPNFWVAHIDLANVLIEKKMYAQALTHLAKASEQARGNAQSLSLTAYTNALAGQPQRARALLQDLIRMSTEHYVPPYYLATAYSGLGERQQALDWLEKAFDARDVLMTFIAVDPRWNGLRTEQRFVSLLERMKLRN
jgi:serine/threonine-protein kinase